VNRRQKVGWLALSVALLGVTTVALGAAAFFEPMLLDAVAAARNRPRVVGAGAGLALLAGLALTLVVRARRWQRGTPGRLRFLLLGFTTLALGVSGAVELGLLVAIGSKLPSGAPLSLEDAVWMVPTTYRALLIAVSGLLGFAAVLSLVSAIAAWFLAPKRARRIVFALFELLLVTAAVGLTLRYDFKPAELTPAALLGASLRMVATVLLGARVAVRMLPLMLDLIERINFRALVAARHLRAKKSGFLAAISFLSIMAVSVSSCALTTTLSVMGGFRQDLKRKILGNNAHIVVDRPDGKLSDYERLSETVRGVPGVRGVSPYVSGEVMISSASNLAGAVLRGIDLEHIGEVSELPRNMRIGSLTFLKDPSKLKGLPASQLGPSLGLPKASQLDDESETAPGKTSRLTDDLQKALRDATAPPSRSNTLGTTLPGIVVGQELARSLRLYLGDEVNVVTPLGDLGPTGPMPKSRPFRVAGIFYSGMYEYDMKFAYVTLASAQRFLGASNVASGVEITVREPDRAQEVATTIAEVARGRAGQAPQAAGGALRVRPWQELNKNLFGALALEKLAMFIALGIAILVASFCIVGTLTLMVQEKGREVAVLKAMGAADRTIVSIFVLEGTLIGVLGSVLGLGLGYAVCFVAEHFGVRLNPEVYYIDKLPVHIDSTEFFTVGIAAILVSLLVTIYPAQLASRLRPVDALRYE
jgi:lipoprotein-releasing system permease protein